MSSRTVGKCVNFRKCPKADSREAIPVAARDANPVCPNCGHSLLISTPVVHPRRNVLVAAGVVAALLLVAIGFAVSHYLTRGASERVAVPGLAASPAAVSSAPVADAGTPAGVSSPPIPVSSTPLQRAGKPGAVANERAAPTNRNTVDRAVAAGARPVYSSLIRTADKVSVAVHFGRGSDTLEDRANSDLSRLASLLQTDRYRNRKVIVAGFADDTGDAEYSSFLSAKRAQTVGAVLASHGVNVARTFGFGQAIPIGNNATRVGREKNRRVEIFVVR